MKKIVLAVVAVCLLAGASFATHSWGTYHWARTTSSFNLTIVNSTTSSWDPYVATAVDDWSASSKLNMVESNGSTSTKTRRQCKGPTGQVRICNLTYGNTGWLGIAGISINSQGHITTGYTKLNDTYFNQSYYNNPLWKQSVTCQELGHNIGLDHQDEDFNNASLFSCMDYQDPPFEHPNAHDYEQLETIYGHTDSSSTSSSTVAFAANGLRIRDCDGAGLGGCGTTGLRDDQEVEGWGISLGREGAHEMFLRIDPDGTRHVTHVTWALEAESQ